MDLRSWRNRGEAAAQRGLSILPHRSSTRVWPLLGVLALGMVTGAVMGIFAASQMPQLKRLASQARRFADETRAAHSVEPDEDAVVVTSHRANNRRKAISEV
jgi:hypothetical protein